MIAPGPAVNATLSPNVKHPIKRFGARAIGIFGCLFVAAIAVILALCTTAEPNLVGLFLPATICIGVGGGLGSATLFGVAAGGSPAPRN